MYKRSESLPRQLAAIFTNSGKDPAFKNVELWYDEGMFWGKLGHGGDRHRVNTYVGHRWNTRVDGEIVKEFVITDKDVQTYAV